MSELYNANLPIVTGYDDKYDKSTNDEVITAAKACDPVALYELASRYRLGVDGVEKDCARAVKLYKSVLKYQTNVSALYHIGFMLTDGACGDEGVTEGFEYLKAAYSLGDADSAVQLGIQYEFGELVPQDLEKAAGYYSFAIINGRDDAIFDLGEVYRRWNNLDKARECYEKALAVDSCKEDAEQRLAELDKITTDVATPEQYVQEARSRLGDGNYMDAFKIINEGNRNYPDELSILYEMVDIYDIVLHASYFSGNSYDILKQLCDALLPHISVLRSKAYGDPNYLDRAESDVNFFLAEYFKQKEDVDTARDFLNKVNVDHTPMGANSIFSIHVDYIDRFQNELANDARLLERAVKSGNWPTPSQKALAYLGLSLIYSNGAPGVPQDLAYAYECAQKSDELDHNVGGSELAKYRKDKAGKLMYFAEDGTKTPVKENAKSGKNDKRVPTKAEEKKRVPTKAKEEEKPKKAGKKDSTTGRTSNKGTEKRVPTKAKEKKRVPTKAEEEEKKKRIALHSGMSEEEYERRKSKGEIVELIVDIIVGGFIILGILDALVHIF